MAKKQRKPPKKEYVSIFVSLTNKQKLFNLKCEYKVKSIDDTLSILLKKIKK